MFLQAYNPSNHHYIFVELSYNQLQTLLSPYAIHHPLTISTTFRLTPNSTTTWSFGSRFDTLLLYTVHAQIYPKYWKQLVMNLCIFWHLHHDYQQTEVLWMRSMEHTKLIKSLHMPLKSREDIFVHLITCLPTVWKSILKNFSLHSWLTANRVFHTQAG